MNIWDNKELLTRLEKQRGLLKELGKRLSFDCFHLKTEGGRAYCSYKKRLGQARDGSLALIAVLRGICSGTCKKCEWFNTEEEK